MKEGTGWTGAETMWGPPPGSRIFSPNPNAKIDQDLTRKQLGQSGVSFLQKTLKQLDFHSVNNKSFLEKLKSQFRSMERIALHDK